MHLKLYRKRPFAQDRQLSGLLTHVAQFWLHETHKPLTDTFLLSVEHSPVQVPREGFRFKGVGHEVQKSARLRQVVHFGSHERHTLLY